jgi:serine protein kinase
MSLFNHYQSRFDHSRPEEYSLEQYLNLCKTDPNAYATAAERLLMAIGEPEVVDTSKDAQLSRIFSNKMIRRYPAFSEFYGMEDAVEKIVAYFRHAAQGLRREKTNFVFAWPCGWRQKLAWPNA